MNRASRWIGAIAAIVWAILPSAVSNQTPPAWHQWRGPNRDGISPEKGLLKEWPAGGPPRAWRITGAGTGYSSFSVSNRTLFTMGARGGTEFVVALDAATGKKLWETPHGRRFENDRGDGPRGTPTIDGDRLYALGGSGDLSCMDVKTGRINWSMNLPERFRGHTPTWGYAESPLVVNDRVLVNAGGSNASIVALNKMDGSVIWRSQSDEAAYSSPILVDVGGVPQAVFFTGERALGVGVRDGRLLWEYPQVANRTANVATPIARGNRVFVSSDYGTGAALLELRPAAGGIAAHEVYFTRSMRNHHSTSVLVGEHLYGFSSSILTALRFADGQVAWRDRSVGKGSLIYADERLYLFSEDGVVGLAEATPAGYREKGRFSIQRGSLPTWTHPVVADGRLYLRDQDTVSAFDIREKP